MRTSCVLCGFKELAQKYTINGFHILQCKKCGILFVGEQLSAAELKQHYDADDEFIYTDAENRENLGFYYSCLRDQILRRKAGGRILDVGCSSGYFLDYMNDSGWECHGIEMVEVYARNAAKRYADRIFYGTLDEYPVVEERFDVITLQDVLDHLPDPAHALEKCRRMLKPSGLIVIKVHDLSSWYARLTASRYYALVPPIHLVYFDRKNLFKLVAGSGFRIDGHGYFPHMMFLKTILFRLSQKATANFFYRLYQKTASTWLGKVRIKKNLYDIVTVFAIKD